MLNNLKNLVTLITFGWGGYIFFDYFIFDERVSSTKGITLIVLMITSMVLTEIHLSKIRKKR